MNELTIGVGVLGIMLLLLVLRVPISFAFLAAGFGGWLMVRGSGPSLMMLGKVPYTTVAQYAFTVVAFFLVMGEWLYSAGGARASFDAAYKWMGRVPGGLAVAATVGCAAFSAMCGSSVATAASMGKVAIPEMKRFHYDNRLAAGSVAAAGTLGIMIPPSGMMVLYGILTEQSIGKLLIAGILPGLLLTGLFIATVCVLCTLNPRLAPLAPPRVSWGEKFRALPRMWSLPVVMVVVIGGIYSGIMTPTEAGAGGAFIALIVLLASGNFKWSSFQQSLLDTGKSCSMLMLILVGAFVFSPLLAYTGVVAVVANFISGLSVAPPLIMVGFAIMYIIMGCFLDGVAMVVITLPIVYPVVTGLGFDPIWFGVFITMMVEIGQITPPVGVVGFVIGSVAPEIPLTEVFKGIVPFFAIFLVAVALLLAFPQIALFLPSRM